MRVETDGLGLRRIPRQERSRRTVEAVLAAATDILVEQGPDALNTDDIAAAAGLSVGALYEFFPSKDAVIAILGERSFQVYEAIYDEVEEPHIAQLGWDERLDRTIDRVAEIWADKTATAIWNAMQTRPEIRAKAEALDDKFAQRQADTMAVMFPSAPRRDLLRAATLIGAVARAGLDLSIAGSAQDTAMVSELKLMLRSYIEALITDRPHWQD